MAVAGTCLLIALACVLLMALALPQLPEARRIEAQQRWAGRPFGSYRIAVRIEYAGNICSQELETSGERLERIISNNCRLSWLSLLTVGRLFEISERLEQPAPCYPSPQVCLCHRVRVGEVAYDPGLGYPTTLMYRREVRPNLAHLEFWRRMLITHALPSCSPADQDVRIMIMSLTPLSISRRPGRPVASQQLADRSWLPIAGWRLQAGTNVAVLR